MICFGCSTAVAPSIPRRQKPGLSVVTARCPVCGLKMYQGYRSQVFSVADPLNLYTLVELYLGAGLSIGQIADAMNLPKMTVYARLRTAGVKFRPRGTPPGLGGRINHDDVIRTVALYEQGYSSNDIKRIMGLKAHDTVINRLRIAGVPIRSRSESARLARQRKRDT